MYLTRSNSKEYYCVACKSRFSKDGDDADYELIDTAAKSNVPATQSAAAPCVAPIAPAAAAASVPGGAVAPAASVSPQVRDRMTNEVSSRYGCVVLVW